VNLPFLKPKTWPTRRKLVGESRYGFSEDDDLIEHALDELIEAREKKDHKAFVKALKAIIQFIKNKEESDASIHAEA
jgi:hypothetical protein